MKPLLGLAVLALTLLATPVRAADETDPKTGIKVGQKAPAFTLKDQQGKEHSLDELLKGGKVALVFYRSARW
jgi:cytochrome oxidase Cu insertion factor (SCO1/SenC/PrrC family)